MSHITKPSSQKYPQSSDGKPSQIPRRTNEEKKSEGRNPKEETVKQIKGIIESLHREIAEIESEHAKYSRYSIKSMPNKERVLQVLTEKTIQKQKQLRDYKNKLDEYKQKGLA